MIELADTTAGAIAAEFLRGRRRAGSPAMGMVMTLVFVVEEEQAEGAMKAARLASREHPARVLGVILGDARRTARVDAQVGIGAGWAGETALIRLHGEVTKHPESVVVPLLLPDSPVVVWWPTTAPDDPAEDPLGRLGRRRITDAAAVPRHKERAMLTQCRSYAPGNTDLAWTRITNWRALLAAALDQGPGKVVSASVTAEKISPSADLLSAWLADRLRVQVERGVSDGPGITSVVLETKNGPVSIVRHDAKLATLTVPGQPDRPVALKPPRPGRRLRGHGEEVLQDEQRVEVGAVAGWPQGRTVLGMTTAGRRSVVVSPSPQLLAAAVAERLVLELIRIQHEGRVPSLVLTGGSIADRIHRAVLDVPDCATVDWGSVDIWFGDERFVPAEDSDRNVLQARNTLLSRLPLDPARVHPMPPSDGAYGDDVDAAAAAYADELAAVMGDHPRFDVLMLGVGPDGHCASLFPGHEAVHASGLTVAVRHSPKPPPTRISLTMDVLRGAEEVWFVAAGTEKAQAVANALTRVDVEAVPASGPTGRRATWWFVDEAAASRLPESLLE